MAWQREQYLAERAEAAHHALARAGRRGHARVALRRARHGHAHDLIRPAPVALAAHLGVQHVLPDQVRGRERRALHLASHRLVDGEVGVGAREGQVGPVLEEPRHGHRRAVAIGALEHQLVGAAPAPVPAARRRAPRPGAPRSAPRGLRTGRAPPRSRGPRRGWRGPPERCRLRRSGCPAAVAGAVAPWAPSSWWRLPRAAHRSIRRANAIIRASDPAHGAGRPHGGVQLCRGPRMLKRTARRGPPRRACWRRVAPALAHTCRGGAPPSPRARRAPRLL
jgi:hypothetical protein